MKKLAGVFMLLACLSASARAQSIAKALTFAQIASGESWETVINITNRGVTAYTGQLNLFTMTANGAGSLPWNPMVNGQFVTNGHIAVSIPAGSTQLLMITAPTLQVGFGTITPSAPSDMDLTSFVEGSLTYYYLSGKDVVDSIGVEPSGRIYNTTIPFDTFSEIAFALANTDPKTASVKLTVYSALTPASVLGTAVLSLGPNAHIAEYLSQVFPGIPASTAGRLDIECAIPIYGLALTQAGSQFSSLPFQPAVKTYNWTVNSPGGAKTGTLSARLNGTVMDYVTVTQTPSLEAPRYVAGTFVNGGCSLVDYDVTNNQIKYWNFGAYSPTDAVVNGTVQVWTLDTFTYLGQGTVTLTATN